MLATRQNQAVDGCNPWCLIGSLRSACAFATDGLQFAGLALRGGEITCWVDLRMGERRLQHEHAMAVIRDAPLTLAPQAAMAMGFFGLIVAHHPEATATADLQHVDAVLALPEAAPSILIRQVSGSANLPQHTTLFSSAPQLGVQEWTSRAGDHGLQSPGAMWNAIRKARCCRSSMGVRVTWCCAPRS